MAFKVPACLLAGQPDSSRQELWMANIRRKTSEDCFDKSTFENILPFFFKTYVGGGSFEPFDGLVKILDILISLLK